MPPTFSFSTLWDNYPSEDPCRDPKTGGVPSGYSNQCAIRLGTALEKSGVSFASYVGGRCPHGPKKGGMIASAQGLANWLKGKPFSGCPKYEKHTGTSIFENIDKRTGIVFLANYWQRPGETGTTRTGDCPASAET
jgi:Type VI secretion system (T6SS), amidase effector protein 4